MRLVPCLLLFIALMLSTSSHTFAQYRGGYGNYGGGHASTAAEGRARGMADVIRSQGAKNLMDSEAAKNLEDARKKNIANRLDKTETYFEMRRVNKQAREAEAGPRPTQQDLIRYAEMRKPDRLTTSEVDPLTGEIAWPSLLLQDPYKGDRDKLNELYVERAVNGHLSAAQITAADNITKSMAGTLKTNIDEYPPQLYSDAKRFLESLKYETFLRPS